MSVPELLALIKQLTALALELQMRLSQMRGR
jgi:hypothetical protein